jgi:RNA polymerase sigma-70 factor, ECF subfamily
MCHLWKSPRSLDHQVTDHRTAYFEQAIWPHARAAFNFARWLVHNDHDAEDIVQESMLKALEAVHSLKGDVKPWLLAIVRNTAMNFVTRKRPSSQTEWTEATDRRADTAPDPERSLIDQSQRDRVRVAIQHLPGEFREALVLREIEGLPYKEIGHVLKIPMGTVMSRLSRARTLLAQELLSEGVDV